MASSTLLLSIFVEKFSPHSLPLKSTDWLRIEKSTYRASSWRRSLENQKPWKITDLLSSFLKKAITNKTSLWLRIMVVGWGKLPKLYWFPWYNGRLKTTCSTIFQLFLPTLVLFYKLDFMVILQVFKVDLGSYLAYIFSKSGST